MRQETFTSHLRQYHLRMHTYRIGDAASLLGVSADTVRRLADGGKLTAARDGQGHRIIPGPALGAYARQLHPGRTGVHRLLGPQPDLRHVTVVTLGDVLAPAEIQAGPFRVLVQRRKTVSNTARP